MAALFQNCMTTFQAHFEKCGLEAVFGASSFGNNENQLRLSRPWSLQAYCNQCVKSEGGEIQRMKDLKWSDFLKGECQRDTVRSPVNLNVGGCQGSSWPLRSDAQLGMNDSEGYGLAGC